MRHLALFALLVGLVSGCGKNPAPPPADTGASDTDKGKGTTPAPPVDDATAWRNKQLAALKVKQDATRRVAIDELSWLVTEDNETGPALVEMLKDKNTNGRPDTRQVNSVREAASLALLKAGPKGEALLKEKGLAILRDGLSDSLPTVREHSAHTLAQLGPLAKPFAADIQKLCTDKDANVRGTAFDSLRIVGIADPVAFAKLLKHENSEIVGLAAEQISMIPEMPEGAVSSLAEGLTNTNTNVQTAAVNGLAAAGPKAAPALPQLIDAINKYYAVEYFKPEARIEGLENAFWFALSRIGAPAVAPTAKLLEHANVIVRSEAARTLGTIGTPAKSAKDALKKALNDRTINVSAEAAVTLCKIGEAQDDAAALIKQAIGVTNEGVAAYAIEAIARMGETGKPLVALALTKIADTNAYTRFAVVALIGKLPPDEAAKQAADVGKRALDEVPEIRRLAGRVLEQLGALASPAAGSLKEALAAEKELDIRDQFVEALIAMGKGAKPALPALLPLVAEKGLIATLRTKAIAAVVVADAGSPEVAAAVVKAATDGDKAVRAASASAMGHLNPLPQDALNLLVKMAKSDPENVARVTAYRALTTAGPRAKPARTEIEALTTGFTARVSVLGKGRALAAVDGDVNKSAPLIRAGLTDRNGSVRSSATEALLVVGPTTADLPVLMKLLKENGSAARIAAATALGRLGPASKDAVPQLTLLLGDTESEVRLAAAEALGRIGPAALPAVAKLKELARSDFLVKTTAERALEKIGAK